MAYDQYLDWKPSYLAFRALIEHFLPFFGDIATEHCSRGSHVVRNHLCRGRHVHHVHGRGKSRLNIQSLLNQEWFYIENWEIEKAARQFHTLIQSFFGGESGSAIKKNKDQYFDEPPPQSGPWKSLFATGHQLIDCGCNAPYT